MANAVLKNISNGLVQQVAAVLGGAGGQGAPVLAFYSFFEA